MLALMAGGVTGCAGPAQVSKPAASAQNASIISGKVVETMDAGGYTYLCLEKDGQKTWVAAPVMKVSVGDEVKLLNGAAMSNFQSKALNRTFDKIIFSGGVEQAAAPAKAEAAATPKAAGEEGLLQGKVLETMNAANYTYMLIEKDGKRSWAAIPQTKVAVGDEVELVPGSEMANFKSNTLQRTFESITFSGGLKSTTAKEQPAAAALPEGHPKLDGAAPAAAPATPPAAAPAAKTLSGKVVETMNAGGYTYLCLEHDGQKTWAAVPAMQAKVGDQLTISAGRSMGKFTSKSLNRTFDSIVFSDGVITK